MELAFLDWIFIFGYIIFALFVGIFFVEKASGSTEDFFLSGRSLPWWLAGTSMVATSFATDAPLAATKLVREQGLAGLWFPLSWVFADLLTLYFFARMWRRANVTTDAEVCELRYSGPSASFLRVFSGLYSAIPMNCIIMGWVTLAMVKILDVSLGWPKEYVIPVLITLTVLYAVLSGLWGVVVTDLVQFAIATIGAISLCIISVKKVGGVTKLKEQVLALPGFSEKTFNFFPDLSTSAQAVTFFLVVIGVQWWAQKNVAGGGQLTQRMFACKDEKHSMMAVLWFSFCHYVIRPWPWMIVALCSLVLFPQLADNEVAYPKMIMELLPTGLRGIMIASLIAAFMSTIDTHLNWGASYLVIDVYKRYFNPQAKPKHYVAVSRLAMILLALISGLVAFYMESIVGAWKFLATMTAGVGPVYILRWYWWRINAYSEITALLASGIFSSTLTLLPVIGEDHMYPQRLVMVLILTTVSWLVVTFLTPPTDQKTLMKFYLKVRPPVLGWYQTALASKEDIVSQDQTLARDLIAYMAAALFIVSSLFGIGKLALGFPIQGVAFLAFSLVVGRFIIQDIKKRKIINH